MDAIETLTWLERQTDIRSLRAAVCDLNGVMRGKRIPVEQRAEAAVIAWLRHSTTAYDSMVIPRVRGKRREVRRLLARRSHDLLERYRRGEPVGDDCPLRKALVKPVAIASSSA